MYFSVIMMIGGNEDSIIFNWNLEQHIYTVCLQIHFIIDYSFLLIDCFLMLINEKFR